MMVTPKTFVVLYIFSCKVLQVLLSHLCSATGPGLAQCTGRVWIEPAPIIQMGQDISVYCCSNTEYCQGAKLYIQLNKDVVEDRLLTVINKTTVQLHLHGYRNPFSTVLCYVRCPEKASRKLICGTQFCMGYLPDRPENVTCTIPEQSTNMTCTWDSGKVTHLGTIYRICLKGLQTEEEQCYTTTHALFTIPLSQLQKSQTFSVSVCAENELGTVHSDPLHVDLQDIVIPALPIPDSPIIAEHNRVSSPAYKIIMRWEKQTAINGTSCEERYKEAREWDADFKRQHRTEYDLDANTKYEFQVRCRLTHVGSFWSRWSNLATYTTPEAEPSSVLNVWRYLGPTYQNGSQEVTIFIKPFNPKESRGRILGYRVFCENQGEIINLCTTTETKCKVLVPAAVTIIYVTAFNSKGSSKPANITVNQQPHNYQDFLPPTNMTIMHDEQKGISVAWEPPKSIGKPVLWYIVEWISIDRQNHYHHGIVWKKVPIQNTTTYIQEGIRMESNLNISVYAVYQDGVSKACFPQSYSKEISLVNRHTDRYLENTAAITDDKDDDTEVLLGVGTGVTFFSIFLLVLIAKKSCRKRVSTACISLTPKWLFEDYPKVQNSSVIKSLQGKNGSVAHGSTGFFLDYEDAVVTEVEEISVHREYKALNYQKETKEAISENVQSSQEILLINNSDMMEEHGYKPQVSNKTLLGNALCSTYGISCQSPDAKSNPPTSPMDILIRDYTSQVASIRLAAGTDENTFSLEKMRLVLNSSRSGQSNVITSTDEQPNTPIKSQWKFPLSDDNMQEQTLIPDEMLSCLGIVKEDSTDFVSYFPQTIAK